MPAGFLAGFNAYIIPFFLVKNGVDAVFFLSAFLVLQTVNYLTDPLGQVFLPRSANWHQEKSTDELASLANSIFSLFLQTGLVTTVQLFVLGDLIAFLWFGAGHGETAGAVRCLCFALIPVLFYTPLRSILDGIEKKPLITHFLSASCTVSMLMCFVFQFTGKLDTVNACWTVLASNTLLFVLLVVALYGRISFKVSIPEIVDGAAAAALLGLASWFIVRIPWQGSFPKGLAVLVLVSCVCMGAFVAMAWARKPLWWRSLAGMFMGERK
jgi:O-antigen/teichoic acid export membrane protein